MLCCARVILLLLLLRAAAASRCCCSGIYCCKHLLMPSGTPCCASYLAIYRSLVRAGVTGAQSAYKPEGQQCSAASYFTQHEVHRRLRGHRCRRRVRGRLAACRYASPLLVPTLRLSLNSPIAKADAPGGEINCGYCGCTVSSFRMQHAAGLRLTTRSHSIRSRRVVTAAEACSRWRDANKRCCGCTQSQCYQ
jgi:hypothetical protein